MGKKKIITSGLERCTSQLWSLFTERMYGSRNARAFNEPLNDRSSVPQKTYNVSKRASCPEPSHCVRAIDIDSANFFHFRRFPVVQTPSRRNEKFWYFLFPFRLYQFHFRIGTCFDLSYLWTTKSKCKCYNSLRRETIIACSATIFPSWQFRCFLTTNLSIWRSIRKIIPCTVTISKWEMLIDTALYVLDFKRYHVRVHPTRWGTNLSEIYPWTCNFLDCQSHCPFSKREKVSVLAFRNCDRSGRSNSPQDLRQPDIELGLVQRLTPLALTNLIRECTKQT